jgi:hypothetical protein
MTLKFIAATVALGTALASTPAPAMPTSNLAAVAPSMTDNVRYCRYPGCGRVYVRRYVPSYYSSYSTPYPYYSDYGPAYSGGYYPYYGGYGYGGPGISFGFGGFGIGIGGGWGHRGRW